MASTTEKICGLLKIEICVKHTFPYKNTNKSTLDATNWHSCWSIECSREGGGGLRTVPQYVETLNKSLPKIFSDVRAHL